MNRFIACALLGLGVASFMTACGDDDSGTDPGTAGTNTGGTNAAGDNSGGTDQGGSTAGKAAGGSSGSGGGGAPAGGAGTAGSSAAGTNAGGDNVGGEAAAGGMGGEGVGAGGEGGAGGAPPVEVEEVADPYWLSLFCDAQSAETLACTYSEAWVDCFRDYYPYLPANGGEGICPNEQDYENFPLTLAMYESMGALATACPEPSVEDWSCDLAGAPQPSSAKCATAIANTAVEYSKCTDAPE